MTDEPWVKLAAEIHTESLETYLGLQGFKFDEALGKTGAVYRSTNDKVIIVPRTTHSPDYRTRIFAAVETLSRIQEEDKFQIAKAISGIGFDVLKIRTGIGSSSHSLDLDEALDALHNGYNSVDYSAVKATWSHPVKYIRGRRTNEVSNYLDTVRMGQTEPGSFVLTLLLPTARSRDLADQRDTALGLGQRVSNALSESLAYSQDLIGNPKKASHQISANFAQALAEIVAISPEIEIGVDQRVGKRSNFIRFVKSDEESLREVADFLAPKVETRRRSISGTVIGMHETRGQRSGIFLVETKISGELKNVRVPYTRTDRKLVIAAYDEKADVKISVDGVLIKSASGRYSFEEPVNLTISRRGDLA